MGPAATTPPSRISMAWVKPGGTSSRWCVTSTMAGAVLVAGQFAEAVHQVLAAAKVQPGGGLVQQQQFRVRHQGTGDLDALAFPLGQRGERRGCRSGPMPHSFSSRNARRSSSFS